jgi:hypothetical protein
MYAAAPERFRTVARLFGGGDSDGGGGEDNGGSGAAVDDVLDDGIEGVTGSVPDAVLIAAVGAFAFSSGCVMTTPTTMTTKAGGGGAMALVCAWE